MDIKQHYKDNYKNMCNVARKHVQDNSMFLAEECVQQAYTNLLRHLDAGNSVKEDFDGLLYKIMFNAIHDSNAMELKRGMTGRIDRDLAEIHQVEFVEKDDIPIDTFESMCLNIIVGKFKTKSKSHENVLKDFFVKGYSHDEISSRQSISCKTSRNIVSLYLKGLRDDNR